MFFGFLGTCSFCDRDLFVRFEYGGDTENRVQLEGLDELIYFICLVGLTAYGVIVRAISTISLHRYLSVKTRTLLSKHILINTRCNDEINWQQHLHRNKWFHFSYWHYFPFVNNDNQSM